MSAPDLSFAVDSLQAFHLAFTDQPGYWQDYRGGGSDQADQRRFEFRAGWQTVYPTVVEAVLVRVQLRDGTVGWGEANTPIGPEITALGLRSSKQIYLARQGDQVVTAIIPATARDGYSGDIEMIVGVNRDGTVAGLRVLSHKETPGLGDKVDMKKSDWVLDFDGRSLEDPTPEGWAVKKDKGVFDSFTGATITPRAVVSATRRTLEYARDNAKTLYGAVEQGQEGAM